MAISKRLKQFLEEEGVEFEPMHHSAAFTASEIAGAQHVPGKNVIKSVIVKSGDDFIMCVLPAIHLIDFDKLSALTGDSFLVLASEEEIGKLFPEYEIGAEPPFGDLYGLPVYIDSMIKDNEFICFNAGSHTDLIKIKTHDYLNLVKGKFGNFGRHV
ncbi:MAG: YbaK/EbsC family protein [Chlamydiales bacterium]